MHLDFLELRSVKAFTAVELGRPKLDLQVARLVLDFARFSFLLKQKLPELACLFAVVLNELLDELFVPSVHGVQVGLLFVRKSVALPVECLLYLALNVFVKAFNLRLCLSQVRLFVAQLKLLLANFVVFLL